MNDDCIFCKIIKKEIPADIVYEDDKIMAFRDINPVAPCHLLVIPKKHIASLNDLEPADSDILGYMYLQMKQMAQDQNVADDGYRIVANCNKAAGQEVFHIHLHLIGGRNLTWPPG